MCCKHMNSCDLGCSGHCLGIHAVDDLCRFNVLPLPYREVQEIDSLLYLPVRQWLYIKLTVRLVSRWLVKDVVYYRADGDLYSSSPLLV